MNLEDLPEDCFARILSLTSPRDVCRVSFVSSGIKSTADSNAVWEKFLPTYYEEILTRLVQPVAYFSKKELFFRLCNEPKLIDGGNKTFSLDISTGKIRYIVSSRELSIMYASDPLHWTWKPFYGSRFAEVAELRSTRWLEIQGKINSRMLSPNTVYGAFLIVKYADRGFGLNIVPSEVSVEHGKFKSQGNVNLGGNIKYKHSLECVYMLQPVQVLVTRVVHEGATREDGWDEIELGSFYNDGGDREVEMSLREVKGTHLKGGLIVEGIELRPKVEV